MVIRKYPNIFVPTSKHKVKAIRMGKTKKNYKDLGRGSRIMIARMVSCSPKYVGMVLNDKLGEYADRDTCLVNEIRRAADKLQRLLN